MKNKAVIDALNKQLANLHIMNIKLHNYHWNIKGNQFFGVHELTEGYYDHFFKLFDDVAERILQLEGKPFVTVKDYLANAVIKEESSTEFSTDQVLKGVLADFKSLLDEAKEIKSLADEQSDAPTTMMMDDFIGWLEKAIWMLTYASKK